MNDNCPDHYFEAYWVNFKNFILNVSKLSPIVTKSGIEIDKWVETLNRLKLEHKYVDIERQIEKYIATTGWLTLKYSNLYHIDIFITQLKRWQDVPSLSVDEEVKKKNKISKIYFVTINDPVFNTYINLIHSLYGNSKKSYENSFYNKFYSQIHIPDYDDPKDVDTCSQYNTNKLYDIIPQMIEDNKIGSLDIMANLIDLPSYFNETYHLKLPAKINAKKILQELNKKK